MTEEPAPFLGEDDALVEMKSPLRPATAGAAGDPDGLPIGGDFKGEGIFDLGVLDGEVSEVLDGTRGAQRHRVGSHNR